MITKTPEQQADDIVGMFNKQLFMVSGITDRKILETAILHVTGIIEVLGSEATGGHYTQEARTKYQQILTILKSKL